jgi:hypothetical protein
MTPEDFKAICELIAYDSGWGTTTKVITDLGFSVDDYERILDARIQAWRRVSAEPSCKRKIMTASGVFTQTEIDECCD